jgi:metal-responsive CopG/Arc/MetJ family transcriptional regulator
MSRSNVQKISISLPEDLITYAERYQKQHGLKSRSDVIGEAMRALRERELIEGYIAMRRDYETAPDPLLDAGIADELEPSTEADW